MTHDYPVAVEEARRSCASAQRSLARARDRMFIFTNLLFAVAQVLDYVLWAYVWILIGRIVISFVQADHKQSDCAVSLQRDRTGVGAGTGALTGDCRRIRSLANRCLDRRDVFAAFFWCARFMIWLQTLR